MFSINENIFSLEKLVPWKNEVVKLVIANINVSALTSFHMTSDLIESFLRCPRELNVMLFSKHFLLLIIPGETLSMEAFMEFFFWKTLYVYF